MYSFSIRQFIWEYIGDFYDSWMFGPNFILMLLMFGGEGGYEYDVDTILFLCHLCMFPCMYVCMYVRMYVRTYVHMYICTYVRMYVCTYVRMYVRTYVRISYVGICRYM